MAQKIPPITGATRDDQIFMHAVGSALACAGQGTVVQLELPPRQPSPLAQKQVVAQKLAAVMTDMEKYLRALRAPVKRMPQATTGRILVERGEVYDAVARTYTPGPGFVTMVNAIVVDAQAEMEKGN
ncbi:hypothetical protein [Mycolicibacter virginiensis]|uniref:hypothetical protein n=1 Tax=Mycolicibacter virginiensis TaxID=1795032 RepID=UPI001F0495DC|nr:hypothetical protein [Mycolicibacter virginiensis]ULP45925.1 hypothetical protein MJO54_13700 [Mycolicibacter virginiensis]